MPETITLPRKEYLKLKEEAELDHELLGDIARGIKDILAGKVKEI